MTSTEIEERKRWELEESKPIKLPTPNEVVEQGISNAPRTITGLLGGGILGGFLGGPLGAILGGLFFGGMGATIDLRGHESDHR